MGRLFETVFGIALIGGAAYTAKENIDYARSPMQVMGSVVQVMNRVEIDIDESSFSLTQAPVIEFTPIGSKTPRRFRSSIWTHAWFGPKTGENVPVVYLEREPENARIATWQHWLLPLLLGVVGVAAIMGWATSASEGRFVFRWNSDD